MGKSLENTKGSVWALFLTTHAVLIEQVEARLARAGLPPLGWYDVLWGLERAAGGRLRMHELAGKVVLSRSNLTRLVDRLEEAGLVARERSAEDRRGAFAVLTEEGKAMRRKMWPVYEACIREYFGSVVSDDEARVLAEVLRRMLVAARKEVAPEQAVT
jgi:DNA-binding MarR family transcriptional regulator